jgi:hypothetical protein
MARVVVGLIILIGVTVYIRHQFHRVVNEVTAKPRPVFPTTRQESQRKCILCGGTGQMAPLTLSMRGSTQQKETCRSCNGTGWVQNPLFGP